MLDPMGERTLNHLLGERVAERPDQVFLTYEDKHGRITELSYRGVPGARGPGRGAASTRSACARRTSSSST